VIRSSALLIGLAMAVLAAGVLASSLALVYVSIGLSILAAALLTIGVFLRREEIFGAAATVQRGVPSSQPAADVAIVPARADGRAWPGRDDRGAGEQSARPAAGRDRPPAAPGGREPAGPEPAVARAAASTDGELGWPEKTEPEKTEREEAAPGRGRDEVAASWEDRQEAAPWEDGQEAAPWEDGQEAAPWEDRDTAASGRDHDATAAGWPMGFRVPPFGDRQVVTPGSATSPPAGDELGERSGEELADGGKQGPAHPAWPATAGPRAMGTGAVRPGDLFRPSHARVPEDTRDAAGTGEATVAAREASAAEVSAAEVASAAEEASTAEGSAAEDGAHGGAEDGSPAAVHAEEAGAEELRAEEVGAEDGGTAEHGDEPKDEVPAEDSGREPDADSSDEGAPATVLAGEPEAGEGSGAPEPAGQDQEPDRPGTAEREDSGATSLEGEVTIVPGVSRYHRRRCILIRFLSDGDLETMTRGRAEAAGCVPCKACQPDKAVPG
jgi:hypothetical protein